MKKKIDRNLERKDRLWTRINSVAKWMAILISMIILSVIILGKT